MLVQQFKAAHTIALCTLAISTSGGLSPSAIAQSLPLVEFPADYDVCRGSGSAPLPVYTTSNLTVPVGQPLAPNTPVKLTGVFKPGRNPAQIKQPVVGWVSSGTLQTQCPGTTPSAKPPVPFNQLTGSPYCRRLRLPGDSPRGPADGLIARNAPSLSSPAQVAPNGLSDGPAEGAQVQTTGTNGSAITKVADNRVWMDVWYVGRSFEARRGWVFITPAGFTSGSQYISNCQ
ncbi:hypothetical protein JOY44_16140 [Phormidium sp. CLA17]|uniref:hypothetical protein n=1 Tax=Leptolyngbya sp. Cla-17 TaxID=2803751 RepID=UPI001491E42F|nr:hypothetical protein [Leptolyngbya sp. Cla-17]MBM0743119.1 hypothetical protein [Leptolyngbya sp. Cla-17]